MSARSQPPGSSTRRRALALGSHAIGRLACPCPARLASWRAWLTACHLLTSSLPPRSSQVHFNYTISRCPPDSHVQVYLNDVQLGGEGSVFWCKPDATEGPPRAAGAAFMWHGLSGVVPGSTSFHVILQQGAVVVAHASAHFDVVEGHGRFFGVNRTTLVDGHGTAAYFRSPANRSVVRWDPQGVAVELISLNFIPGRNGYMFQVTVDTAADDVVESESHLVSLRLSVGTHCLTVRAYNVDAGTVGPGDVLCVRVVPPQQVAMGGGPVPDCGDLRQALGGVALSHGLVIDTPKCEHSAMLARACPSCRLILCAPQLGDGLEEEEEEVYTRESYHRCAHVCGSPWR